MSIEYAPVVYPTPHEFQNFHKYMEYLEKTYSQQYGIVKIVPPPDWKPRKDSYNNIDSLHIPGPIEQNAYGRGGAYECAHVSQKAMTVGDFKKRTKSFQSLTDGLNQEEIEALFWKNVSFSSPLYAADIHLNLMDQSAGGWNLDRLDSVLTEGMRHQLPGVNTSYCYFGSWKSFFCWHTEDMELSAINFLHFGKPKFWYGISPKDKKILEQEAKYQFPSRFQKCPEYLRHKTTLISPYKLKTKYPNLVLHKQVQYPGQFIIAFNGAYHSGFNSGFNIAEAVNYATFKWLRDIKVAKYCKCVHDTVRIIEHDLASQLSKSKLKSEPEVIEFIQSVKHLMVAEEDKNQDQSTMNKCSPRRKMIEAAKEDEVPSVVKNKKIQKPKGKGVGKVQSQQVKIDNWAQCQKCKKWRKVDFRLKRTEHFLCKQMGINCSKKEESSKQDVVLG